MDQLEIWGGHQMPSLQQEQKHRDLAGFSQEAISLHGPSHKMDLESPPNGLCGWSSGPFLPGKGKGSDLMQKRDPVEMEANVY